VPLVGAVREDELAQALPDEQRVLITPILASLAREGLIVDDGVGTWDYEASWRLTRYGHRFIRFLPGITTNDVMKSTLVALWTRDQQPVVTVRNLGPGSARLSGVQIKLGETPTSIQHAMKESVVEDAGMLEVGATLDSDPELPVHIDPGVAIDLTFNGPGADVLFARERTVLTWTDESGAERSECFDREPRS
jgi:hypothetical protein